MEKDDKGSTLIRIGVSGCKFLLVPAYPGCPGSKAVKRSLLLLYCILSLVATIITNYNFSFIDIHFHTFKTPQNY